MSQQTHHTAIGEVRIIALSRITPAEGFNPRTERDTERFAQLVASVKADGILQPLLVTADSTGDGWRVVAGEGRYLAAGEAGQTEVPVHIVDVDERTGGLELAMAENLARQDLDPVQEARGYARLRTAGLTKKGIAERLGIAQRRVTERLEILKLPEQLHPRIAGGRIPPAAIKPLVALERIAAGLAACAAELVDAPPAHPWQEPVGWAEVVADPVGTLLSAESVVLPAGVYDVSETVPVERFSLSEAVSEQLAELCELIGGAPDTFEVRFGREALERAASLKALHAAKSGWSHLLVGQDVADELAADYIASCLEVQRKAATRASQPEPAAPSGEPGASGTDAEPSEDERREARRQERADAEREREHAVAYNAELGAAILKHLGRVKVDADVLKVLTAVDVAGDLDGVAARGARYAFPGWMTETAQKNGKVKIEYLDKPAAGAQARGFLDGAQSMAEIAGRLFCLIAAARYADERAVARSNRSMSWLNVRGGLPYSTEVIDLIDQLCAQRLPEHLTTKVRAERAHQREVLAEHARTVAAARERIDAALDRAGELSDEERAQAESDIDLVHGPYSIDAHKLRKQIAPPNDDAASAGQDQTGGDDDVAQAA